MTIKAQNANHDVKAFDNKFALSIIPSFYEGLNGGNSTVRHIADLSKAAKIKGFRATVLDSFMETYGVNYELNNFKYIYENDSITTIALHLNIPSNAHRSKDTISCLSSSGVSQKFRNQTYANLYEPIWDDSLNGKTPVNEKNYYARYVYDLVSNYNKYVKIYEVWSNPDASVSENADKLVGQPGNWWENNPQPCDLPTLHAPFNQYVRMLRITYEVVKRVDTNAFVSIGGISRANFLEAILRNTDNPNAGQVTSTYPLKGGAYFDMVSYQSLPQYTLKDWNPSAQVFVYKRHSDAAVKVVMDTKNRMYRSLEKFGYDGITYPKKHLVISKTNIPRIQYLGKDFIGSISAQKNFVAKLYVAAQKNDIKLVNFFTIGDTRNIEQSTAELEGSDLMGLYYNLNETTVETATLNNSGVAVKNIATHLQDFVYNSALTATLQLDSLLDGAAFTKDTNKFYVIWAKTKEDLSENAARKYTFPTSIATPNSMLQVFNWDGTTYNSFGNSLNLSGSPIIVRVLSIFTSYEDKEIPSLKIILQPNPARGTVSVLTAATGRSQIVISDVQGKILLKSPIEPQNTEKTVDISGLRAGIYLLRVEGDLRYGVEKLVVE